MPALKKDSIRQISPRPGIFSMNPVWPLATVNGL